MVGLKKNKKKSWQFFFSFVYLQSNLKIMTTLLAAMQTENSLTENGMTTNSSSLNDCVNLFFQIGAMRGKDKQVLINTFVKAYNENALTAMRLLFWARDVRGGAGERQIFRDIVQYLANTQTKSLSKNISLFSEYGRWDDLLVLIGTKLENEALSVIKKGLEDGKIVKKILSNIDSLTEEECEKLFNQFSS
jgi:hypothetical protein